MKKVIFFAMLTLAASISAANAKGCIKGALVGGVAGHGFLGAAAGCLIGRHEAKKQARLEQMQRNQQNKQKH